MEIDRLEILIGTWKTSGEIFESPFGPAGELKGHDSYKFSAGRDYIVHTVKVKMAGKAVSNSEIISFDAKKKAFAMFAFENGQTAGLQHARLNRNKWTITSPKVRFAGEFSRNGKSLDGKWFYQTRTGKWRVWMTLQLRK